MSLGIKIILLLCSFPLLKPVPQPSHTRAHLWPRPHSTLATPDVFSQGLPVCPHSLVHWGAQPIKRGSQSVSGSCCSWTLTYKVQVQSTPTCSAICASGKQLWLEDASHLVTEDSVQSLKLGYKKRKPDSRIYLMEWPRQEMLQPLVTCINTKETSTLYSSSSDIVGVIHF